MARINNQTIKPPDNNNKRPKNQIFMKWCLFLVLLSARLMLMAEEVVSPNGQTRVSFYVEEGRMTYEMWYKGRLVVAPSPSFGEE